MLNVEIEKYIGSLSLGNLNSIKEMKHFISRPQGAWKKPEEDVLIQCPLNSTMVELMHYGLAFKDQTVVGQGYNKTIKTVDGCSFGSMKDLRAEYYLEE